MIYIIIRGGNMQFTWYTDYTIQRIHFWKCATCQNLVPFSQNNMNYCGHCGEPKYYLTTERKIAEERRKRDR